MKPLEDGLEGMIESGRLPDENTPVGAYLKSNPEAREEVAAMMDLSRLIRENFTISAEERDSLEPAPGFMHVSCLASNRKPHHPAFGISSLNPLA